MLLPVTRPAGEGRFLLVEDEEAIRHGLTELFRQHGYQVDDVGAGLAALERIARQAYDLVVLDLMLPDLDGLEVLARIRAQGVQTPVLILTARGAEQDVVAGLERGADDYVTKPFGVHELVARARGLLRRGAGPGAAGPARASRRITVGDAVLDLDALAIHSAAAEVPLTAREGLLVEYLVSCRHRVVTREELLVHVWGYQDGTVQTRTVDVHIQQLRAKLKRFPGGEGWIQTVRGRGYRFEGAVG